jgi:hypothetical protein
MGSFLGVPIRIRDVVFGNLYLTESTHGEFSAEDEELTTALAATAAAVIDISHLYEAARLRGEWLQATAAITRGILAAAPDDPVVSLRLIADRSREVADADVVTIALPNGGQGGISGSPWPSAQRGRRHGPRRPAERIASGQAFTTGKLLRLTSPDESPSLRYAVSAVVDAGPLLIVLRGSDRVHGVLNLVRLRGRAAFSAEDLDLATGFANQAAVALELAQARADQQRRPVRRTRTLPRTCTTTSSSASSPPDCRCRHSRPPSGSGAPPTASCPPSGISTPPSARSAPPSSSFSRPRRPPREPCARASWTWSASSPRRSGSTRPSASPACSTPLPTV